MSHGFIFIIVLFFVLKVRLLTADSNSLKYVDWIITPKIEDYSDHVFHQYTLQITNGKRNQLKEYLDSHNIGSMIYYPIPLYKQKAFLKYTDKSVFKCFKERSVKREEKTEDSGQ